MRRIQGQDGVYFNADDIIDSLERMKRFFIESAQKEGRDTFTIQKLEIVAEAYDTSKDLMTEAKTMD